MVLMEKYKYLEPNFSSIIMPIVKYCVSKYKIHQMSSRRSKNSSFMNEGGSLIMDVVLEEDNNISESKKSAGKLKSKKFN